MPESAVARLQRTLRRLDDTEPLIHAYVDVDRAGAADAARRAADAGSAGALGGRPFGVKEVISVAGLPAAGGSPAFADHVASSDATVVRRLRDAGAVLIGTQVSHELTCGLDEPATRNPWALDSYPGGSSAGGGASVAVGSAAFALGTDAAGSVRIPAAMTGVVGLKPTAGLVSMHGVVRHATAPSIDNVGIIARSVVEVSDVLAAVAGPDPGDASTLWQSGDVPASAPPGATGGLTGWRVGTLGPATRMALDERTPPEPDVWNAFDVACEVLRDLGAELVPVEFPGLAAAPDAIVTLFATELAVAHRELAETRSDRYHPRVREMIRRALTIPRRQVAGAVAFRTDLRSAVLDAFAGATLDVLALPTTPRTAMPLASFDPADELGTLIPYTCPFNLTGQPAVSVPCGFAGSGVPIGMQLVGAPFKDASLLDVAAAYEQVTTWHEQEPEVPRCPQ
jgi:Asp-tRNA(Asn)/Glu-tRNA(Gln) amidotransferase A subunit family amidase